MLLIVSLVVAALATSSVATNLSAAVSDLVCAIGGGACETGGGSGSDADAVALAGRLAALAPLVEGSGGALGELSAAAQAALARGDLDAAEDLIERLELYRDLIGAGPRGELVDGLVSPTDAAFADLLDQGTIQEDGGAHNLRYFQVPAEPGQGVLAMDLFIPGETAGPLQGDDRGFADPLRDGGAGDRGLARDGHHRPRDRPRRDRADRELHRLGLRPQLLQRAAPDLDQRRPRADRERLGERRHRRGDQPRRGQQLQRPRRRGRDPARLRVAQQRLAVPGHQRRRHVPARRRRPRSTSPRTTATASPPTRPTSTCRASPTT